MEMREMRDRRNNPPQKTTGCVEGVISSVPHLSTHLGLGRAYALQGDTAKAKAAYQDFLMLWKDADPDVPILKQSKAEYAKLH